MKHILRKSRWKKEAKIFTTYSMVSLATTLLYLLMYFWLVEFLGFNPFRAAALGYVPCLLIGFWLCHSYVFDSNASYTLSGIRYLLVNGSGYVINMLGVYITVELIELNYMIGQLLTFIVVALNNFVFNRIWTFSK